MQACSVKTCSNITLTLCTGDWHSCSSTGQLCGAHWASGGGHLCPHCWRSGAHRWRDYCDTHHIRWLVRSSVTLKNHAGNRKFMYSDKLDLTILLEGSIQ